MLAVKTPDTSAAAEKEGSWMPSFMKKIVILVLSKQQDSKIKESILKDISDSGWNDTYINFSPKQLEYLQSLADYAESPFAILAGSRLPPA